jgi:hypothetical protein
MRGKRVSPQRARTSSQPVTSSSRSIRKIGAIVLECTNMAPFARALHLRMPVYDIYSFVSWFHAGLSPRGFGLPGDPL